MKRVLILAMVLIAGACQSQKSKPSGSAAEPFEVPGVNLADGVNKEEAQLLALRYFEEFHGNCGGVTFLKETSDAWRFRTVVGFAATPGEDILVAKDGSKISEKGSPDVLYSHRSWSYHGRNFIGDEN